MTTMIDIPVCPTCGAKDAVLRAERSIMQELPLFGTEVELATEEFFVCTQCGEEVPTDDDTEDEADDE